MSVTEKSAMIVELSVIRGELYIFQSQVISYLHVTDFHLFLESFLSYYVLNLYL